MQPEAGSQIGTYGLIVKADPSKTNVRNTVDIGVSQTSVVLPTGSIGYCVSALFTDANCSFDLNTNTGDCTNNNTPTSQVETATAAGTITLTGTASVVVTGARITGSPITLAVDVENGDNAGAWALKVRAALRGNDAISSVYDVSGSSASIVLTEIIPYPDDATLNIALDNGTCTGITPAASSANTTAGVGGVVFTNFTGDGKDFEGSDIGLLTSISGFLGICRTDEVAVSNDGGSTVIALLTAESSSFPGIVNRLGSDLQGLGTVTFTNTNAGAEFEAIVVGVPS